MKKNYLLLFFLCCSLLGFSQFTENFNSGIPNDWATIKMLNGNQITGTQVPEWGETPSAFENLICEGSGAAFVGRINIGAGNTAESWLITPQVNVPANGRLYFEALQTLGADYGTMYHVRISTVSQTDTNSFTTLVSFTENELSELNQCREHGENPIIDLNAYANQSIYIAFVKVDTQMGGGTNADRWLLDNVRVLAECVIPDDVTVSATTDTATLSWSDTGAISWEIAVIEGGNVANDGVVDFTTNTNSVTITGLSPATQYTYYIRSVCGGNYSVWSEAGGFNTLLCAGSQKCSYTFILTDQYGDGWNGNTMTVSQNGIDLQTLTLTTGTTAEINVDLCNNVPFSLYWNAGGFFSNEVGIAILTPGGEQIYEMLPDSSDPDTLLFSDIVNCVPPTCPRPNNLMVSNVNDSSVDLSWVEQGSATQWQIVVQPIGNVLDVNNAVTVSQNPYTHIGLNAGVEYEVYIRSVCGSEYSDWRGPVLFQTLLCPVSDRCGYKFILTDEFGDGWNGNTISILQQDLVVHTLTMTAGSEIEVVVDLCNGIPFSLYWNAGGLYSEEVGILVQDAYQDVVYEKPFGVGTQDTNLYSGVVSCTPPTCPAPTDLTVSGVIHNQATFSWIEQGMATEWEIAIEVEGTGNPTGNNSFIVNQNPYNHIGLNEGTKYEYYVRSICGANDLSNWRGPVYFETMVCHPDEKCMYNFNMNSALGSGWLGAQMQVIQNGSVVQELSLQDGYQQLVQVALCDGIPFELVWNDLGFSPNTVGIEITDINGGFVFGMTPNLQTPAPNTLLYTGMVSCGVVSCQNPINITVSNITQTSADFDWTETGTATQWEYVVLPEGELPTDTTVFTPVTSHPITVDGLEAGYKYRFLVRSVCDGGNTSNLTSYLFQSQGLPPITVNVDQYTVDQLVEEILISSGCVEISNISWSTGINFGSVNGIGYFEKNNSTFPFENGIVLSTGKAEFVSGPKDTESQSEGHNYWTGDNDLQTLVSSLGNNNGLYNATKLEFDFKAVSDKISFDFIFASEEYGVFQCFYSDAFAFLLTDLETGQTTNLAVVPNTDIPISVTTIRDHMYNDNCSSENEQYFANFYNGEDIASINAPINFRGHTVPLTASSNVVPNRNYHIKLVIADYSDYRFDSAVFLAGGSFNFGEVDLGDDLLIANNTAICSGSSYTIDSGVDTNISQITWYYNNTLIPNETGSTLTVTQSGTYTAVSSNGTCDASDSVVIEFFQNVETLIGQPNNLVECNTTGIATFDLSVNTPLIMNGLDASLYTIEYYSSQADAQNGVNPIVDLQNYTNIASPQTIYVRVYKNSTVCYGYTSFVIQVSTGEPAVTNFSYDATNYCLSDANPTVVLDPNITVGGVFSVVPNLTGFDSVTGAIDLSQATMGTYTITYTVAATSCMTGSTTSFTINILENCLIPRGISPNGDGFNDSFDLTGFGVSKLEIYNRYGRKVYESLNYVNSWKGEDKLGNELPDGTYYYVIEKSNGEKITGWVYINRQY